MVRERGIEDPERRLVHDLVHVLLSPLIPAEQTPERRLAEDRVVQALVKALLPE